MSRRFLALVLVLLLFGWTPALAAPKDKLFPEQWALGKIEVERAWAKSKGAGIVVAVVDSGVDFGHPDLKGKSAGSWNCVGVSDDSAPCKEGGEDEFGHGTAVAGVAAAVTGNGEGIAGVAPEAKIMSVRVLGPDGTGEIPDIARGVKWAADKGAKVINLSLGPQHFLGLEILDLLFGDSRAGFREEFQDPVDYAANRGALVVAAAGNDGSESFYSGMNNVYVVGATGPDDEEAPYSSTGADIHAPGGNDSSGTDCPDGGSKKCILTTQRGGQYVVIQGTSFAAPHVAGVAALLMSTGLKNGSARDRMAESADAIQGGKRINAAKAVGAAEAGAPPVTEEAAPEGPPPRAAAAPKPAVPKNEPPAPPVEAAPPAEADLPAPPEGQSEGALQVLPVSSPIDDRKPDERAPSLALLSLGLGLVAAVGLSYVRMRRRAVRRSG